MPRGTIGPQPAFSYHRRPKSCVGGSLVPEQTTLNRQQKVRSMTSYSRNKLLIQGLNYLFIQGLNCLFIQGLNFFFAFPVIIQNVCSSRSTCLMLWLTFCTDPSVKNYFLISLYKKVFFPFLT